MTLSPDFTAAAMTLVPIVIVTLPKSETLMLNSTLSPTVMLANATVMLDLILDTTRGVEFTLERYLSFSVYVTFTEYSPARSPAISSDVLPPVIST